MTLIKACDLAECPSGTIKSVKSDGKRLFVADISGTIYACSARCTHLGGPLDEGKLDGANLTCPWHGSIFNVTNGKVVRGPASVPVSTYRVQVKGTEVFVEI